MALLAIGVLLVTFFASRLKIDKEKPDWLVEERYEAWRAHYGRRD